MSSNVGLSTPRGSGTSGYVQRNFAFMKPRNAGYGAPYPPISDANSSSDHPLDKPFKQRQPDKQILEHDRRRAIEVKVMEERERLEEENERIEEERSKQKKGSKNKKDEEVKKEEGEEDEDDEGGEEKVLTEEEIDERCEALRKRLVREMEEEEKERERGGNGGGGGGGAGRRGRRAWDLSPKERRQFKSYQVHELAEAKIEESERLRRALGIKEEK
ncbi:U2-type spliceosomal complex subunit CWC21 [Aspergillus luchuensis]|uniref:RNA binding protein n=1 Tax=Aspergillus kawachii TaxID=1069201 RepID=A0A146FZI0_ASPKA|nr:RNA-splicing factor [Aspergillus luchuensis]BCS02311.1 RNA-splicing factor [Aspergillus luchuensis]BCS13991.1 RNA-splicing factor [Aspergillus luchuensis]GAA86318.1 RNA binding protein [Aspergillus luchuensis IFO 4308]GAT30667.1 RNA binding protein [Aspergillus luchuensis]